MVAFDFPSSPAVGQTYQAYMWDGEKWISTLGGIPALSSESQQFLARTSGLSATYYSAYAAFIDGLVIDEVWTKFDVLRVHAAPDTTTALLNLVSSSYTATAYGSPAFTAGQGFAGVNGSSTVYIDSNFNPTIGTPKYTQNSAHLAVWVLDDFNIGTYNSALGYGNSGNTQAAFILARFSNSNTYMRINGPGGTGGDAGTSNPATYGFLVGSRSGASLVYGYKFGARVMTDGTSSVGLNNLTFYDTGNNANGVPSGSGVATVAVSYGSALTAVDVACYYNRLVTFIAATHISSPLNLSGLLGWWDASVTASLTLSGSDVTAIADQSGNGNHLTGATSNKPTYNATGFNYLPSMMFSAGGGRKQRLVKTGFPLGTAGVMTVFFVGYLTSSATNWARACSYLGLTTDDYNSNSSFNVARDNANAGIAIQRNSNTNYAKSLTYGIPIRVIATIRSDGAKLIYVNGVDTIASQATANWVSGGTFSIGACDSATTTGEWDGAIAEFGITNTYTDQMTVIAIDAYLANKWSLQTEVLGFLSRTSGLDATHVNAYITLIKGLVADGVWYKLDVLHIYATQNSATALLNLVSASFNGTISGAPTFTADRGFTGVEGSAAIGINTGFNPVGAAEPHFTQNSGHLSSWVVTNGNGTACLGSAFSGANTYVAPRLSDFFYLRVNTATFTSDSIASADSRGHSLVNRSGSNAQQGYKNGSLVISNSNGSSANPNGSMWSLGWNNNGTLVGYGQQMAAISIGSSLTATQAAALYSRLRVFMTAVGVP